METNYILEEMKYQAESIVMECDQKLNWWYFSEEYIQEKLDKVNALFNDYKNTK